MACGNRFGIPATTGIVLWLVMSATAAQPLSTSGVPVFLTPPAEKIPGTPPPPPPDTGDKTAPAARGDLIAIDPAPPPGFESLVEAQTTLVDVYYGNRPIANVMARFDTHEIELLDPAAVAARVPWLTARQDVVKALTGRREIRPVIGCRDETEPPCPPTAPTVADYGFDPDRFRVDLFINPRYIERIDLATDDYLDDPPAGLSSLHTLDLLVSRDDDSRYGTLTDNSIVAVGRSRLVSRMTLEDEQGFFLDTLRFEHDLKRWTWSAGTMNLTALVSPLLSTQPIVGVRAGRTLKMRHNLKLVRSSPIFVYLDERSRVDILRDGKRLVSRFYNPGNRQLDTSTLPDGTYEIVVRIHNSRGTREEHHLFTRSILIPPADHALHFIEAGRLLERARPTDRTTTPRTTDTDLLRIGSRFRLRNNVGAELDTTLLAGFEGTTQAGLYYFLPRFSLHGGLLGGWKHSNGSYFTMNWRAPSFNLNLSHQRLDRDGVSPDTPDHPLLVAGDKHDLSIGTTLGNGTFTARLSHRGQDDQTDHSVRYSRPLLRRGPMSLAMNVNWNRSQEDQRILFSLQYTTNERHLKKHLSTSWRDGPDPGENGLQLDARVTAIHDRDGPIRGRSQFSARGAESSRTVGLRLEHEFPQARTFVESRLVEEADERSHLFTAGAHLTISTTASTVALSPQKSGQSGLVIDLGNEDVPVEIEINDRSIQPTVKNGKALFLLEPYREYEVSLRAGGDRLMRVEMERHKVALYPGNVARLDWKAMPVFVVVGQAVRPDRSALANSRITNLEEFSATDEGGWFQVELASMQTLRFKTREGGECQVELPRERPTPPEGVVVFDQLLCRPLGQAQGTSTRPSGQ